MVLPCHELLSLSKAAAAGRWLIHGEVVLRLRTCCNPDCHELFTICTCCDRGQRYCSDPCRDQMRRKQLRAANRRLQESIEGRQDHRDRQREFRRRRADCVTYQGSQTAACDSPSKREKVIRKPRASQVRRQRVFELRCVVCGRRGHLVDPFPRITTRR